MKYYSPLFPFFLLILVLPSCQPRLAKQLANKSVLRYSHVWERLQNYPLRYGRNDDLYFFSPEEGFIINSQGSLFLTRDGGESWEEEFTVQRSFFRCLTFKDRQHGWLGTLGTGDASLRSDDPVTLYATEDGGESWTPVEFEGPYPTGLCGLQTVSDRMIVGCGRVRGPSFFIKSTDGGLTWRSYDYDHLAGSLIAPYFYNEQHGILIGGTTRDKLECRSLVLETFDGGDSWDTIYVSPQKGEYCWKVDFPTRDKGFISIQRNASGGYTYYLETFDGGKTWSEHKVQDGKYYVQGVGFVNEQVGWLGGHPRGTKETRDGGKTWYDMADAGRGYNNFQFFGDTVGYGVGFGVYKMNGVPPVLNGPVNDYNVDGTLRSTVNYLNGIQYGPAVFYHPDGTVKCKGKSKHNERVGRWRFYHQFEGYPKKVKFSNGAARLNKEWIEQFAGRYQINENTHRQVTLDAGKLYSKHSRSQSQLELIPLSPTEFKVKDSRDIFEFVLDEKGELLHQLLHSDGQSRKAEKVE